MASLRCCELENNFLVSYANVDLTHHHDLKMDLKMDLVVDLVDLMGNLILHHESHDGSQGGSRGSHAHTWILSVLSGHSLKVLHRLLVAISAQLTNLEHDVFNSALPCHHQIALSLVFKAVQCRS